MKKLVLTVVAALAVSVAFTSCDTKKLEDINAALDSVAAEVDSAVAELDSAVAELDSLVADSAATDSVAE